MQMMHPAQAQQVVYGQGGGRPFHSGECDMCAEPGGVPLCCYVTFCTPCAAGDVAQAAGRDYLCSCLIGPALSWLLHDETLANMLASCLWVNDRRALVARLGVHDHLDDGSRCSQVYFMYSCGCGNCLLFQALNHLKAVEIGRAPPVGGMVAPKQMTM